MLSPPTFTLELAHGQTTYGDTIWIIYGIYPSLGTAKDIAAARSRPCRIVAARVIWTSPGAPL